MDRTYFEVCFTEDVENVAKCMNESFSKSRVPIDADEKTTPSESTSTVLRNISLFFIDPVNRQ